jgi:hypothetical protein
MSKDSFSWKSLFFNDEKTYSEKKEVHIPSNLPQEATRFPVESSITNPQATAVKNQYIDEILDVYEAGFNSLNIEGFDFFEMYKSVVSVGVSNPQSYHMAFTMGKTLKGDLTKEFLIEKSKFYISEIENVHKKYDEIGKSKNHDLEMAVTRDKVNLTKNISDLENKIAELQTELEKNKLELSQIDVNSLSHYNEINLKIEANNFAKKTIIDSISIVVDGINQYL